MMKELQERVHFCTRYTVVVTTRLWSLAQVLTCSVALISLYSLRNRRVRVDIGYEQLLLRRH
jgi:hypothetical protein